MNNNIRKPYAYRTAVLRTLTKESHYEEYMLGLFKSSLKSHNAYDPQNLTINHYSAEDLDDKGIHNEFADIVRRIDGLVYLEITADVLINQIQEQK